MLLLQHLVGVNPAMLPQRRRRRQRRRHSYPIYHLIYLLWLQQRTSSYMVSWLTISWSKTFLKNNIFLVPNTVDAQLKITNLEFIDDYINHDSLAYKSLSQSLENEIKKSITSNLDMVGDVNVKIMNLTYDAHGSWKKNFRFQQKMNAFSSGSVVVDYRVSWDDSSDTTFTPDTLLNTVTEYLSSHNGYLNNEYQIPANTIQVSKLVDACSMHSLT